MFSRIGWVLVGLLTFSMPALAYIGPGMGAGAIGVIVGLVGSIFLALFSIFYYPLKRRLKKSEPEEEDEAEVLVKAETEDESRQQ
jgi:hypothetical protein